MISAAVKVLHGLQGSTKRRETIIRPSKFGDIPIKLAFDLLRQSIGLLKDTKSLISDDEKRAVVEKSLEEATLATGIAEAQIAKGLGYHLCKCTFPPQIMLWQQPSQVFACPKCDNELDPNVVIRNEGCSSEDWV